MRYVEDGILVAGQDEGRDDFRHCVWVYYYGDAVVQRHAASKHAPSR